MRVRKASFLLARELPSARVFASHICFTEQSAVLAQEDPLKPAMSEGSAGVVLGTVVGIGEGSGLSTDRQTKVVATLRNALIVDHSVRTSIVRRIGSSILAVEELLYVIVVSMEDIGLFASARTWFIWVAYAASKVLSDVTGSPFGTPASECLSSYAQNHSPAVGAEESVGLGLTQVRISRNGREKASSTT